MRNKNFKKQIEERAKEIALNYCRHDDSTLQREGYQAAKMGFIGGANYALKLLSEYDELDSTHTPVLVCDRTEGDNALKPNEIIRCAKCGSTHVQRLAWVLPNNNNKFVDYSGDDDDIEHHWCDKCQDHVEVIFSGELPDNLYQLMVNELQESYKLNLCPDCGSPLTYEINEGVGKQLEEQYRCKNCGRVFSMHESYLQINKRAEEEFDNIKDQICRRFQYGEKNEIKGSSSFESFREDFIDLIIDRNS